MPPQVVEVLVGIRKGLEIVGAGALVFGFVIASGYALFETATVGGKVAYEHYRRALGRVVLVGLEILVAATILKTVTIEPTPASLGLLAFMIGIRTVLGWTTVLEMEGRWPWQRKAASES